MSESHHNHLSEKAKSAGTLINKKLHTRRGRNIILYMLCFLVAFAFWLIRSLDQEVEYDYELVVKLKNVPDSVEVLTDVPPTLSVLLKGKGNQFFKYHFVKLPEFVIDYRQYVKADNSISVSRSKIDSRLREMFGQTTEVLAVSPDSLHIQYATQTATLPVRLNVSASAATQSVISGNITSSVDYVKVYSISPLPRNVKYVETQPINLTNVSDTTVRTVSLVPIPGAKLVPSQIQVTVPAEVMMSKTEQIDIVAKNMPDNRTISIFPHYVELSYLVPMSKYNDDLGVIAYVDYDEFYKSPSVKAKVHLTPMPKSFRLVNASVDSVGYVIEHH